MKGVVSQRRLAFLLLTLALTDLTAFNALGLEFRAPCDSVADLTGAATYLSFQDGDGPFRIYSPSYSIPQQVAASYELELADGVDPLILASYQAFMEPATGVPSEGYSVTLPPYADDPSSDNRFAVPDAELLGILNVKYVVAEFEIPGDDFRLLAAKKDTRIYENLKFLPRAWVQDEGAQVGRGIVSMPDVKMGINHIRMQATGPGLLVLSEVMYPGWRVKVDGKEQEVETVNGLLRGVRLVEGSHQVVFSFWPVPVFAGAAISGAAWLGALAVALVSFWRRNRAGAAV